MGRTAGLAIGPLASGGLLPWLSYPSENDYPIRKVPHLQRNQPNAADVVCIGQVALPTVTVATSPSRRESVGDTESHRLGSPIVYVVARIGYQ